MPSNIQSQMIQDTIAYLGKKQKEVFTKHAVWKDNWDDIITNIIPKHRDANLVNQKGEKTGERLFDSTAKRSNNKVRDNLQSLLTPPSGKWFEKTTGDRELDSQEDVKKYLNEVERIILKHINNSNFHTESLSVYEDIPSLGTGVIYIQKADKMQQQRRNSLLHFESERITKVGLLVRKKEVIGVIRCQQWKAREILEEFEGNLPDDFARNAEKAGEREYEIAQYILHKSIMPDKFLVGSKPWRSFKVLTSQKWMLTKPNEGWNHKPFSTPRWHVESDEDYGRGPGSDILPDQKTASAMKKIILQGGQLAIAPPLQVADNGIFRKIKYKPWGINFRKPGKDNRIEPLITGSRPDIGEQLLASIQADIEEGYYKKALEIVENDRMTATEVVARRDENLRGFGSVLVRVSEMSRDVVENAFIILERAGELPEAPAALKESKHLSLRYTSLLARSQIQAETENFTRAISNLVPLIEVRPEVIDNLDGDFIFRETFHQLAVDDRFLIKVGQRDKNRQQAAERAQQQQQVEEGKTQSETVKNLSAAESTGV